MKNKKTNRQYRPEQLEYLKKQKYLFGTLLLGKTRKKLFGLTLTTMKKNILTCLS